MKSRTIFTCLLMLALAGCVTTKVPEDRLKAIKSIAVLPVFEDVFHYQFNGVFMDERDTKPVPDWNLNDYASSSAAKTLARHFEVVSGVEIDRAAALNYSTTFSLSGAAMHIFKAVKPHQQNVDAYLILARKNDTNVRGLIVHGIGVQRQLRPMVMFVGSMPPPYSIHAAYWAWLVDGRSGELIAQSNGDVPPSPHAYALGDARIYIHESEDWPKDFPALWQQKEDRLRSFTYELLDTSIPYTLRKLGLSYDSEVGK